MKTLTSLILSILCTTSFLLHSSTHEELLRYDLTQRQTTQKLIVNLRNVTGITTVLGICAIIYIGKQTQHQNNRLLHELRNNNRLLHELCNIESTAKGIPAQLQFQEPTTLPLYFACPILLSAIGFVPSLITFVTSALYGIYNGMHIETLQQELAKLEHIA